MMGIEYYNYKDLGIVSSLKPPNAHLFFEEGTTLICVEDDGEDVYYSTDKGDNWNVIDEPTTHDVIVNAWHDKTNKKIYFQATTAATTNATYELDASDADPSNWSITEIGINLNHKPLDIWIRDGNLEQLICDTIENDLEVWRYTDPNWNEIADYAVQDTHVYANKAVIIGTDAYFVYADALGDPSMFKFTGAAITKLDDQGVANREVPETHKRQGMSYDDTNIIYFLTANLANDTFYLTQYAIATDTMTELHTQDFCMQLDRNTASGVKEKAFHPTEYKVYQLHGVLTHQWHLISKVNTDDYIISITDNYLMNNDGDVFEYADVSAYVHQCNIKYRDMGVPSARFEIRNTYLLEKGLFIQIKDMFTTATVSATSIIFEGYVSDFEDRLIQKTTLLSPAKTDIDDDMPSGDYSGRTDEIISTLITDYCDYITAGTMSAGTAMGTITFYGDKTLREIINDLSLVDGFIWYLTPTGKLYYNNGTVDSGENFTATSTIAGVRKEYGKRTVNYVNVKGGFVSGSQITGTVAETLLDQELVGKNKFERTMSFLDTAALCTTANTNILARWDDQPLLITFIHIDTTVGLIQPGETVTFEYNVTMPNITSDQFGIRNVLYDAFKKKGTYLISDQIE